MHAEKRGRDDRDLYPFEVVHEDVRVPGAHGAPAAATSRDTGAGGHQVIHPPSASCSSSAVYGGCGDHRGRGQRCDAGHPPQGRSPRQSLGASGFPGPGSFPLDRHIDLRDLTPPDDVSGFAAGPMKKKPRPNTQSDDECAPEHGAAAAQLQPQHAPPGPGWDTGRQGAHVQAAHAERLAVPRVSAAPRAPHYQRGCIPLPMHVIHACQQQATLSQALASDFFMSFLKDLLDPSKDLDLEGFDLEIRWV